ncbi:PQQ-dependent dehydrogenase, methanol/ethanol family [Hyphococcus luteus]|uniref:PQQ-dependent dehydrogenase, methanol/ethanol family n=1 Tax=Hyphococcus luteus TaxID=2058213 RepID=A0A2S7KA62_9PROT|nr:PQQ-dependent dehydrogenase, methanol/ethanol family [Marinicaulis flavus]PQA89410.1 PQQ-dependent dehydrogenase, methanol/ethanol family [Marinicaulis flavus]
MATSILFRKQGEPGVKTFHRAARLMLAGVLLAASAGVASCGRAAKETAASGEWSVVGGSYREAFYSPLDQISEDNIGQLGLAWYADLDTFRGQEANPVVVDGVIYVSTAWSKVYAFDGKTGDQLWFFDPEVAGEKGYDACCDVGNRGVAVADGKVFVGALDGRLIALDARTGAVVWTTATFDPETPYTITGAPRIVKDKVIIGNGGAEYGVRGYVTAYNIKTGEKEWRFYTVPGDPSAGPDGEASDAVMKDVASATWFGKWYEYGGGGTVWDAIVYDKDFDQVLIGVGNGSPWNYRVRSDGKGDNLFLSSIVALDADTGAYKWHYQETPAESWDFTATQPIILAELVIDGKTRKVAMQAPKNGFFYVLDRTNGELATLPQPFVSVNWAEGVDNETGRPVVIKGARWSANNDKNFVARPGAYGAHSWHPMAYSPDTELVYIPTQDHMFGYQDEVNFRFHAGEWNLGNASPTNAGPASIDEYRQSIKTVSAAITAFDPVKQKAVWRVQHEGVGYGGILATGGNLLFQGEPSGQFSAYKASDGEKIWSFDAQSGPVAAAASYEIDGQQYVAVLAGFGGVVGIFSPYVQNPHVRPNGRLLVFKLGGSAALPDYTPPVLPLNPPAEEAPESQLMQGMGLYAGHCMRCHGGSAWSAGVIPDLRRSAALTEPDAWKAIVLDGALSSKGMVGFHDKLGLGEVEAIRAYVGEQARAAREGLKADGE